MSLSETNDTRHKKLYNCWLTIAILLLTDVFDTGDQTETFKKFIIAGAWGHKEMSSILADQAWGGGGDYRVSANE